MWHDAGVNIYGKTYRLIVYTWFYLLCKAKETRDKESGINNTMIET